MMVEFEIGKPSENLPPQATRKLSGAPHWTIIRDAVDGANGAWVPITFPEGRTQRSLLNHAYAIKTGKIKAFPEGEYTAITRNGTLWIKKIK